jgi:hypothetical protein
MPVGATVVTCTKAVRAYMKTLTEIVKRHDAQHAMKKKS